MANLQGRERVRYVQGMFTRIANRYDLMNRIMTAGQDVVWRNRLIELTKLKSGSRLLDLGSGTGDIVREALKQHPGCLPVAADLTLEMMRVGKKSEIQLDYPQVCADALELPFTDASFDAVASGFLLRNVIDVKQALEEQFRILKPGGRVVILDTTRPYKNFAYPAIQVYFRYVIPTLGKWITGQEDAYRYLPETTQNFLEAETLAAYIQQAGFINVSFVRLMAGTIAIHWADKME